MMLSRYCLRHGLQQATVHLGHVTGALRAFALLPVNGSRQMAQGSDMVWRTLWTCEGSIFPKDNYVFAALLQKLNFSEAR
jgi:hypothetical protein